ncbi:MAG TPA: hypothetical protein VGZ23_09710 [bacterium]|nr:hypothetical protein [bacterium]
MQSVRKAVGLFVLGVVLALAASPALAHGSGAPIAPVINGVSIDGPDHELEGAGNNVR